MGEEIKKIGDVIDSLEHMENSPRGEHEEEKLAISSLRAAREFLRMAEKVRFEVAPRGYEKTFD